MRYQNFFKSTTKIIIFTFFYFLLASIAVAEDQALYKDTKFTVGVSGWISSGETSWNHDASSAILGNPTSELTYEDVDSNIVEFSAEYNIKNKYFVRGDIGFGSIDEGTLIDDDFLTTAATGDFLASRSLSDIDEDGLWYLNLDFGYTLWSDPANKNSRVRAFVGYQHWEEDYTAKGLTYDTCTVGGFLLSICLPAGTSIFPGEAAISNQVEWDSVRLGVEGKTTLGKGFSIEASGVFIPYSDMHNEDIHHLRSDLQQPGAVMDGTGIGFNLEIAASYEVMTNLFLSAGYRYWKLESDGDLENRTTTGTTVFPLNDLDSDRDGVTVGLSYQF